MTKYFLKKIIFSQNNNPKNTNTEQNKNKHKKLITKERIFLCAWKI